MESVRVEVSAIYDLAEMRILADWPQVLRWAFPRKLALSESVVYQAAVGA